jgi:hypothetical protein
VSAGAAGTADCWRGVGSWFAMIIAAISSTNDDHGIDGDDDGSCSGNRSARPPPRSTRVSRRLRTSRSSCEPTLAASASVAPMPAIEMRGTFDPVFAVYCADRRLTKLEARTQRNHEVAFRMVGGHFSRTDASTGLFHSPGSTHPSRTNCTRLARRRPPSSARMTSQQRGRNFDAGLFVD